jgi:aminoglycoside phosphotransferase (APT) family kinase protein
MSRVERHQVTPDLVRCLVAHAFPQWAHLPVRPVDLVGWDNVTLRLGDALSVRLPSADGYVPQVAKEHRWLPVLARSLPLPIPQPVALGRPACGFPRPWSVYRWLDGAVAATAPIADDDAFARDLAGFLLALHAVDPAGGPPAGPHSFGRGGPLERHDAETRAAIATLGGTIDGPAASRTWEEALDRPWRQTPVWVHGDLTASNLLVRDGRLSAVIDFGCCAVGDPACDTVMAWTWFEGPAAATFRHTLGLDADTWARGRGWALWKALITLRDHRGDHAALAGDARRFGWRFDPDRIVARVTRDAEPA